MIDSTEANAFNTQLDAYETASKRTITLDHMRIRALSEIARRLFTADDVVMVVRYVRNAVASKPKTHGMAHGFSDASIGFQNLMMDVNKFEDRLLEAREVVLNGRKRNRELHRVTITCGDVRSLAEMPAEDIAPPAVRASTRAALADILKGLE